MKPKQQASNIDDISSQAATIGTSAAVGEEVIHIEILMQKHSTYDANYDPDYDIFDDNCVAVISDSNNIREVKPVNIHIRIKNSETKTLVNLGSLCTIINKSLANALVLNSQESYWVQSPENQDL